MSDGYSSVTPHAKSVGGEPRWLPVNNFKSYTTMAKNMFSEENYKDFTLSMNWESKGIEIKDIALHLFPKTDKNPQDLVGIAVTGRATRNIYGPVDPTTGECVVLVEAGQHIHTTMFPRNLPGDIAQWGTIETKDDKKVFTPKVKVVDCDYRIGTLIDDDNNKVLDANGNPIWGQPKVFAVYVAGQEKPIALGSNDKPVPFNG